MKILPYIFALVLSAHIAHASDDESSENNVPQINYQEESDAELDEEGKAALRTIEGLEEFSALQKTGRQEPQAVALQMFGLKPTVDATDVNPQGLPIATRFVNALPSCLPELKVKPQLTYDDLLNLSRNRFFRTEANVTMTFISRRPGADDECFALSDCRLLQNLTPDTSAYCTIRPFAMLQCYGGAKYSEEHRIEEDGLSDDLRSLTINEFKKTLLTKKVETLRDVKVAAGLDSDVAIDLAYRAAVISPIYRLYKGNEPAGVFGLLAMKIEAHDRSAVIAACLPELMRAMAVHIRETEEKSHPDFKIYKDSI
jgi:hypothetical protein